MSEHIREQSGVNCMRWGQKSRKRSTAPNAWQDVRDEVTGLLPYAQFLHQCGDAVTARGEAGEPAVLLVELEGVVEGVAADEHTAADELLRTVASRVAREVGSTGVLARVSDHQLGVLFPTLSAPAVALDLAYRIVSAVSTPVVLTSQRRVQLSSSCGLVTWDSMGASATAADLLRGASLAVREARRAGRNRIEVCSPDLIAVADETLAIGKDLRQALQDQGLRVCYQPLVDLTDGTVIGFEALVRWSHPVHGQVSPSRFVPVAEEFGLISELGRMVLSTATAQIQQWSSTFRVPLTAHVNVSGLDLASDAFVGMVRETLTSSGLPSHQLVLEFTESAVDLSLEVAQSRFQSLHSLGVRVAIDDFGTGRSALAYLQDLDVDILKVDRAYVEADDDQAADDLLRGVIGLGQALGMAVYGEGIEDESQRHRLERNGCHIGQGYLFERPLPAEDAAAYLRHQMAPVVAQPLLS
jgi:EAL domain-containing protein (putative c-di-GMP-specific phosphodiesterase class I)/GGDEF domain-containing protein